MHGTPLPTDTDDTDDAGEGLSLPELTTLRWQHFDDRAAQATWGVIGRRMPALVSQAAALAWRSSPRDVVATAVLNAGVGAATAWALVATTDVLGALHPVLLPLLALAVVPQWWGSAVAARMRYRMLMAFTEGRRRKILLENLLTSSPS